MVKYNNAGAKKDDVPGHAYFTKVENFIASHYEEGENYREYLKYSCQEKVGNDCAVCCEWTGPIIKRCPKPFPDHASLPEYHYKSYNATPVDGRSPDDWQPRVQLRKAHSDGTIDLSNSESVSAFADKFVVQPRHIVDYVQHLQVLEFKKGKRREEQAQKKKEACLKNYHDYNWHELCQDINTLKSLKVPELDKYLKHHGLVKELKTKKADKLKAIIRHHVRLESGENVQGVSLEEPEIEEGGESDWEDEEDEEKIDDQDDVEESSSESDSDSDSHQEDMVLAEICDKWEQKTTTRSGRTVSKKSEIDFFFF